MILKLGLGLLAVWGVGAAGAFAIGPIVHVLLLVGLLLLLLSFARERDAARQPERTRER